MKTTFKRVQMLIEPEQDQKLRKVASQQGKSMAEVTRHVIDLGIEALEKDDEFIRRELALEKAAALRQAMHARRGKMLDVDVVTDIRQMREEHDEDNPYNRD